MSLLVRAAVIVGAFALPAGYIPAMAAQVLVGGAGTWDSASSSSLLAAPGTDFAFSFKIDQTIAFNPTTDFSDFVYFLGGQQVQVVPSEITFYPASVPGTFQMNFASGDVLMGIGDSLLDANNNLQPDTTMPVQFVTGDALSSGFMLVADAGAGAGAVPEPANWLMMVAGFAAVGLALRSGGTAHRRAAVGRSRPATAIA